MEMLVSFGQQAFFEALNFSNSTAPSNLLFLLFSRWCDKGIKRQRGERHLSTVLPLMKLPLCMKMLPYRGGGWVSKPKSSHTVEVCVQSGKVSTAITELFFPCLCLSLLSSIALSLVTTRASALWADFFSDKGGKAERAGKTPEHLSFLLSGGEQAWIKVAGMHSKHTIQVSCSVDPE